MATPTKTLRVLPLMVEQIRALSLAQVDIANATDLPGKLPIILVDASSPGVVSNGQPEWSADFRCTLTAVADERMSALNLAHDLLDGLLASWKAGRRTQHGWFSHLHVLALPYPSSTPGASGLWSFSIVLDVIARH